MEQFILLLVLAGGSHAFTAFFPPADTECDAIQATSPCSLVVGGSVNIKLLTSTTSYKMRCFKVYNEANRSEIFSLKKEKVKVANEFKNRTEFSIDTGTLKIINVAWDDTGLYVVERYDENGKREEDIIFNLQVKENIYPILLPCILALGVLLVLLSCFICCRLKRRRKTKSSN